MEVSKVFEGVYRINGRLATRNISRGQRVYDEELVKTGGDEYRTWNPYRSKLAAAIIKGMKNMRIKSGDTVLYLGASTGTTPSHVSDIVGEDGTVYCVEISERSVRDLIRICEQRGNMLPILCDARDIVKYENETGVVDVMYQDISARDQADILLRNSRLLKSGGMAYVAIKSQSISVKRNPKDVYREFISKVSSNFKVLETMTIEPFDRMHMFAVLQKR